MKRTVKTIIPILLLSFVVTGCTGSFNLTRKVYNFHRSQSDKWTDEICFLLVAIIPVYGFSTLADAIVFNSIEFWTGKNPVEMTSRVIKNGSEEAKLSYDAQSQEVTVDSKNSSGQQAKMILEKRDNMILAKNEQGETMYTSLANPKGEVVVYDQNLNVVKRYSPQEIASAKEQYLR